MRNPKTVWLSANEYKEIVDRASETKKEILQTMKDVCEADDVKEGYIWWMPGPIHETLWERLWSIYLLAGGTDEELKKIWPEKFS